ncbi:iron-containing alcohol dehydrogenase [Parahaliea mediterranea]|uniref:iron-containing alcohol dehydrogenase n=1 Tax=Parahaliea mediterranea TaxID=651086 RepID=UPI000E2E9EB8|nr:iron-containing alcohol dehydrogenase [Parahaliea mediterranea]
MSSALRQFKHRFLIGLMKVFAGLGPAAAYLAFAGKGSAAQLCRHIARSGARRVLVVTDKPLRDLGIADKVVQELQAAGVDLAWYDGVMPDPTFDHVAEGVKALKAHGSDAVLAIGGGSSIDAAKIIAASACNDEDPRQWVGLGKVRFEVMPIYAVPTTSGTGSEATMGAVISDPVTHEKSIISGATLLPSAAALDCELTAGMPAPITAATGMDALTHAIEAYICTWDRGTRLAHSSAAIKLIFEHLETAVNDGANSEAREAMSTAAYYAGIAINQVNVGNVHAIAHQLGGKYGIPHGMANALVLPHVLEFCREEAQDSLARLAVLIGVGREGDSPAQLTEAFIQAVRDLRARVGIPERSDKIQAGDYDYLCNLAMAECENYPVPRLLDRENTLAILANITA